MKRLQAQAFFKQIIRRFMHFKKEERFFVVYVLVLAFFIIFFPVAKIISLQEWGATSFFFLWNNGTLWQSSFVILVSLLWLLAWNISVQWRNFITLLIWFKENPSLVNFGLIWVLLASYIWIGDGSSLSSTLTSTLQLTQSYYIILLLILLWLIFTLYLTMQQAKTMKQNKNIHIHQEEQPKEKQLDGLFDQIKEQEKHRFDD